ncbi:hypothetical protein MP638_000651 [Amoeboaphelidium occidentale]|nr:hypothetical protein MP638_000651 [Amoeboaphelidium occidentale]
MSDYDVSPRGSPLLGKVSPFSPTLTATTATTNSPQAYYSPRLSVAPGPLPPVIGDTHLSLSCSSNNGLSCHVPMNTINNNGSNGLSKSINGMPSNHQHPYGPDSLFGMPNWNSPVISKMSSPSTGFPSVSAVGARNGADQDFSLSVTRTLDLLGLNDDYAGDLKDDELSVLLSGQTTKSAVTTSDGAVSRVLFIQGNGLNENDVMLSLKKFGTIESVNVNADRKGAFVTFTSMDSAVEAKKMTQKIGLIPVIISYSKAAESSATRTLLVYNVPAQANNDRFVAMFERFGPLETYRLNPSNNSAFFSFVNGDDALKASKETNGCIIEGLAINVIMASSKNPLSTESSPRLSQLSSSPSLVSQRLFEHPNLSSSSKWSDIPSQQESPSDQSLDVPFNGFPDANLYHYVDHIPILKHIQIHGEAKSHSMDPGHLRELKRKLELSHTTQRDIDLIFEEMISEIVELSTDGFGNTVVQKLIERCSDQQRLRIIEACAPQLASIGVHKNGTWVVQKMMDFAKTSSQIHMLLNNLMPYTPSLMMDPFGNYVIQACLKLGAFRDQFVFDTMYLKCLEVGRGKFGARAMRACLESQNATKRQQKLVAIAVIRHALTLVTDPNGILLIHWLVDNSELSGRFRALVEKVLPRAPYLSNQKLSHVVILKILGQMLELEPKKELIMNGLFKDNDSIAATIFGGESPFDRKSFAAPETCEYGTSIILRCLQLEQDPNTKAQMTARVKMILEKAFGSEFNYKNLNGRGQFYKRLIEELQQPTVTKSLESLPKSPFINTKLSGQPSNRTSIEGSPSLKNGMFYQEANSNSQRRILLSE